MTQPDKPYTRADVEVVERAIQDVTPPIVDGYVDGRDLLNAEACAVLDALAAAGRIAHDCERRPCPFEDLWNDSDPKPDEALARLQAAFNDAVAELVDARAEAEGARDDYEQLKGFNAELAAERDQLKRLLKQARLAAATQRNGWR